MFGRFARLLRSASFKPLLASSLLLSATTLAKVRLEDENPHQPQINSAERAQELQKMLKKIVEKEVCKSKDIKEGDLYYVELREEVDGIPEEENRMLGIVITRFEGKLYAVSGACPHREPLEQDQNDVKLSFEDAIVFNNKLYCPHHGCAFNVTTGSVQYGPSYDNLARFFVEEKDNVVRIFYPAKMPRSVEPKSQLRDYNDMRKVVVVGGDHNATAGFIHGLKQYDYGGQLTVIQRDEEFSYPYRKDLLHKCVANLRKDSKSWIPMKQSDIQKMMEEKLYSRLRYHDPEWYQMHGINFIFTNEYFRLINKKYFPYLKFASGTKLEFDGILIAEGVVPKINPIPGITTKYSVANKGIYTDHEAEAKRFQRLDLPENVFAPYQDKREHLKMMNFFNNNQVENLLVLGMNIESLQFVEAYSKEFPKTKIKVLDMNKENSMTEIIGPDIGNQIIHQYTKRGVQFYIKIQQTPEMTNKLALNTLKSLQNSDDSQSLQFSLSTLKNELRELQDNKALNQKQKSKKKAALDQNVSKIEKKKFQIQQKMVRNSIEVKVDENLILKGDAMVLFPNNYLGNVDSLKFSKYTDLDYNKENNRIIVDPSCRTDTKRIFAAGSCSSYEFFFTGDKLNLLSANMAYEQGMYAAFNMSALNAPMAYIPYEKHRFFDKTILYAGARRHFSEMYVIGDPKSWDFIAFYSDDEDIIAVSASPSRQKEFQVMRESFRLQCTPYMDSLIKDQWNIPLIYKLIRKLNKSACYKDEIRKLTADMNVAGVIWMQRDQGSFVKNSSLAEDESDVELDRRGYVSEV